ncbi:MAG: YggT family protein [Defluviitaleaceae bacterium]|nr:YggT family protein [Defluviitaleaceae bacterium]
MDALFIRELLYYVVFWFSRVLIAAIFIRVIFSWLPFRAPEILFQITEPILSPVRRMFQKSPLGGSMIDFSPIISLFLIQIIANFILSVL